VEGQKYAEMAEEELSRVSHLTRQSLNFYREATFPIAVDVADSIEKVLSLYTKRIEAKKLAVFKRYLSDGTTIQSYPGEIRQVLSTLLLNAIDALQEGRTIAIHVRNSSNRNSASHGIRITIADNGVGIRTENLPRVFEPFFTTKGENGTGLGLWVANGIINRLGGWIKMGSTVRPRKSGTCFSIFLPAQLPGKT
jgi:two-component system, chemotaxis family, CheB/CheR fusion protein